MPYPLVYLWGEFYGTYYMINERTHQVYSDKLRLSVVNLEHIELANETDKKYHIHEWAALFKATTWEELHMLSEKNDFFKEATESYNSLSEDAQVRYQCEAREDYIHLHANLWKQVGQLAEREKELVAQEKQLAAQKRQLAIQAKELVAQQQLLSEKDLRIARLEQELKEKNKNTKVTKEH